MQKETYFWLKDNEVKSHCFSKKNQLFTPHGIVANMLNNDIAIIKFEPQSCYSVLFCSNTLGKGMNSFIPSQLQVK